MSVALENFRALADPTRLRIMALLRSMELSVGELAQVLGQSQPRVSRHIRILCDAGLASRRKEGSWVFLVPGAQDRIRPVYAAIDAWSSPDAPDHWVLADGTRLAAVRADRAAAAERYFAANADRWDAMRSLYVDESRVEAAINAALGDARLGRLVDIGTGTGRMLELLAQRADLATGIDRSPEMLRVARGKLAAAGVQGCDLRQGDIMALPLADASADTVILHHVLHFLPAPEGAIAEIGRIMAEGAQLLVVDFAPHEREELRTTEAHARLGFSDMQVGGWFKTAGIALDRVEELGGGELTVKIWCGHRTGERRLKAVAA